VEELMDRYHVPSFANKFYVVAQILHIKIWDLTIIYYSIISQ
jgi:hypothetical protein